MSVMLQQLAGVPFDVVTAAPSSGFCPLVVMKLFEALHSWVSTLGNISFWAVGTTVSFSTMCD